MKNFIKKILVRKRSTWLLKRVNRYCTILSKILNCEGIVEDFENNGECALLKKLSRFEENDSVVLDVGANVGNWARDWLSASSSSKLYCFEAVPEIHTKLSFALGANNRVICLPYGLSDINDWATISYIPDSNSGSSISPLPWAHAKEEVPIELMQGDRFVESEGIGNIFFIKIDTEGHEFNVLRGFKNMLELKRIVNIQFEYGYTYIPSRIFLKDIYEILEKYGFRIGPIYPEGVAFRNYNIFKDEDFKMKNYFASLDEEVIDAVQIETATSS